MQNLLEFPFANYIKDVEHVYCLVMDSSYKLLCHYGVSIDFF